MGFGPATLISGPDFNSMVPVPYRRQSTLNVLSPQLKRFFVMIFTNKHPVDMVAPAGWRFSVAVTRSGWWT